MQVVFLIFLSQQAIYMGNLKIYIYIYVCKNIYVCIYICVLCLYTRERKRER
jgi:hypothetical protein